MVPAHSILKPLFRRVGCVLMALALFLIAGGHWAMLQGVAWATMVKDFSKNGSLTEAVGKTFDGKHLCPMCKKIASARSSEERSPATVKVEKKSEVFVKAPGSELPEPACRSHEYGSAPFVSLPELCFAPPVPVPIGA